MAVFTHDSIAADIAKALNMPLDEIGGDDNLIDLGLDSMRAMMLLQRWNEQGLNLDFSDFAKEPTVNGWWALVEGRLASRRT